MDQIKQYEGFVFKREQIIYLGLWFIIPFCSFTSHTIVLVPPTLVLFLIGTLILISFSRGMISRSNALLLPIISIFYFVSSQVVIAAPLEHYVGVVFAIAYFVVVVSFGYKLSEADRNSLTEKFINYSIVLLVAECFWRITHPDARFSAYREMDDIRWIYQYKFSGLMYADSNAVGIHINILLFFIYYLELERGQKWPKAKIILLILLIFTLSRAAWVGAATGWIYIKFLRKKHIHSYLINVVFVVVALVLFYGFYLRPRLVGDISFQSKFDIIDKFQNYFYDASFTELLLGIGFSNSLERLGIYAHNYFAVFFIESGIVGFILIVFLLIQFIVDTQKKALLVIIPFIITTLSATITFIPFFYGVMALIYLDQRKLENP